jgi:hypothetical protein
MNADARGCFRGWRHRVSLSAGGEGWPVWGLGPRPLRMTDFGPARTSIVESQAPPLPDCGVVERGEASRMHERPAGEGGSSNGSRLLGRVGSLSTLFLRPTRRGVDGRPAPTMTGLGDAEISASARCRFSIDMAALVHPPGTFATVRRQFAPPKREYQTRFGHRFAHNLAQIRFTRSAGP